MAPNHLRAIRDTCKMTPAAACQHAMQSMGLSLKGLQRHLERKAIADIYLGQYMKDKGKGAGLADVRKYYDEPTDEFKVEERVKWLDLCVRYRQFESAV